MKKTKTPGEISESVRKYMSSLGKIGGAVNKKKGKAYFQWIRRQSKRHPVKDLQKN